MQAEDDIWRVPAALYGRRDRVRTTLCRIASMALKERSWSIALSGLPKLDVLGPGISVAIRGDDEVPASRQFVSFPAVPKGIMDGARVFDNHIETARNFGDLILLGIEHF